MCKVHTQTVSSRVIAIRAAAPGGRIVREVANFETAFGFVYQLPVWQDLGAVARPAATANARDVVMFARHPCL